MITETLTCAALRRGIVLTGARGETSATGAFTASIELLNLGYLVAPSELDGISDARLSEIIAVARKVSGTTRAYIPMYPNFPAQVRELPTMQLIIDQLLHYLTLGTPMVDTTVTIRPGLPLSDMLTSSKPLRVVRYADLTVEVKTVVGQFAAMSADDFTFVRAAFGRNKVARSLGDIIDGAMNKENRQKAVLAYASNNDAAADTVIDAVSRALDADDLLRTILAIYTVNAGDTDAYERAVINLSDRDNAVVHMTSIPRGVRRAVASKLGEVTRGHRADALVSRKRLWRNVTRYGHLFQYAGNKDVKRALDIVHDNIEFRTYASRVEEALASGDVLKSIIVLEENPGQLIRRLAALVRMDDDTEAVIAAVNRVGYRAKMSTLVSAYNGLAGLATGRSRVLRVAGRMNRVTDGESSISSKNAKEVQAAVKDAIGRKMAAGGVLSSAAAIGVSSDAAVSLVRRDASTTDREMSRGARIPVVGNGDVLRMFINWFNMDNGRRVDLDLGAAFLTKNLGDAGRVDWTSYAGHRGYATFSGDIVDAPLPNGATEFVDIDLSIAPSNAEWVVMTVYSYTGQPMSTVNHLSGAMMRSDADAGDNFDPRTVKAAFTSVSKSTSVAPLAVNLRTREMVWLDTDDGSSNVGGAVSYGGQSLVDAAAFEIGVKRLTEGELLKLYAKSVGVKAVDEAVDRELVNAIMSV